MAAQQARTGDGGKTGQRDDVATLQDGGTIGETAVQLDRWMAVEQDRGTTLQHYRGTALKQERRQYNRIEDGGTVG